jgi:lipoprotein signal peptidase
VHPRFAWFTIDSSRLAPVAATAGCIVILDQATKTVAKMLLPLCHQGSGCQKIGSNSIGFLRDSNAGSVLGFGQRQSIWAVLAVLGSFPTLIYATRRPSPPTAIATGVQIGGAFLNLADRLLDDGVTDFLRVGEVLFNLADLALLFGTAIAIMLPWITTAHATRLRRR